MDRGVKSKGSLPTVIDIMVIWVKFTHSGPFQLTDSSNVDVHSCHLLFDHFQFALVHRPNIPGSYPILVFTASDFTSITRHIHNWVLFILWFCLSILSRVIYPLISSSILGIYHPGEFIFQCPIFLPFHTVHGVLKARLKWFAIPSPVDHVFSELSIMTCPSWMARHSMAHSFTELDKAVVHVISLISFLWLWFSFCLPLRDKDRRFMEASWWERLTVGETGSCSDGQVHAQ